MTSNLRIKSSGRSSDTEVWLDDVRLTYVTKIVYELDANGSGLGTATLTVMDVPLHADIDGEVATSELSVTQKDLDDEAVA